MCRKMISIIFAVLRDNTPYVPAVISYYYFSKHIQKSKGMCYNENGDEK